MLPSSLRNRAISTCLASALTLALALPAAPAFAFNQREQDVIKGIAGTLLLQGLIRETTRHKAPRAAVQPEPYYEPARPVHQVRSVYRTPAAAAFNSYAPSERRLIQRRLQRLGYYRGGVDGSFGPGTYSAVSAYARENGMGKSLGSTSGAYGVYDGLIY